MLFVRPLVECLAEHGVRVWYDEYSMTVGDSLSAAIDRGLAAARFGVVIISPAFIQTAMESGWTHYELRGMISNSIGGDARRIVPVWLDVSPEDVRKWSPSMSDLLAIDASGKNVDEVALNIARVVAPDRAGSLFRMRALSEARAAGGEIREVDPRELNVSPAEDRRVSGHVPLRALLVTRALADCGVPHASDFAGFLEDLSRDLHHERELRLWETIAISYSMTCESFDLDITQRQGLYTLLLDASFGKVDEQAVEVVGSHAAGPALAKFQDLLPMVRGEVVIGEGGMRGLVRTNSDFGGGDMQEDESKD